MDNTLLKMHVYNYNGTRWEGDNEGNGKSKHVDVGNVVQVFGFKIKTLEKLLPWNFQETLPPNMDPKSPNPNV